MNEYHVEVDGTDRRRCRGVGFCPIQTLLFPCFSSIISLVSLMYFVISVGITYADVTLVRSCLISSFDDGNKSGINVLFPFCIEVSQSRIMNLLSLSNSVFIFLFLFFKSDPRLALDPVYCRRGSCAGCILKFNATVVILYVQCHSVAGLIFLTY